MQHSLAILSDLHYAATPPSSDCKGDWADVLLMRAVQRLNRFIKPDAVLLLGDCIDQPDTPGTDERLQTLRGIMDILDCPWIALPGNHDPEPHHFYEIFPRPADQLDVGGLRILPFVDPPMPGAHARRTKPDLARLRHARQDGFGGTVIAAQHVSLYPQHLQPRLEYGYTNLDEVQAALADGGVDLCVGGHSHGSTGLLRQGPTAFLSVDPLCEHPFCYTLVSIDDARPSLPVSALSESLAMPAEYGFIDTHSHTQFAYCGENVHSERSPEMAQLMGLQTLALTEHSGQLYFPREQYWGAEFGDDWKSRANAEHARIEEYLKTTAPLRSDRVMVGLEVDADFEGNLVLHPEHAESLEIVVGAVHVLRAARSPDPDADVVTQEFKAVTERLCQTGIDVLAHPFRIFRRSRMTPDPSLYLWMAQLLKRSGVVAELNFHTNDPAVDFVQHCLDLDVPLTFGGDAHHLYEVGEFYPHLALLREAGVTGNPQGVLWDPRGARRRPLTMA